MPGVYFLKIYRYRGWVWFLKNLFVHVKSIKTAPATRGTQCPKTPGSKGLTIRTRSRTIHVFMWMLKPVIGSRSWDKKKKKSGRYFYKNNLFVTKLHEGEHYEKFYIVQYIIFFLLCYMAKSFGLGFSHAPATSIDKHW